jgi:WD40 repeat protein
MLQDGNAPASDSTLATPPANRDALASTLGAATRPPPGELPRLETLSYQVGPEIARGGLGRILAAHDPRLGRDVALKQPLSRDPSILRRFAREALVTARLAHPAIVPVHEAGTAPDGTPFYAMKLVRGARSLGDLFAEAQSLVDRLLLLPNLIAVADAIAYAHSQEVVHRDLKPSNVLVGAFGETVVIDWGLAKMGALADVPAVATGPAESGLTCIGDVLGTPAYMPPEQARGEAVDARADVYALGAMLHQMLSGAPPFEGKSSTDVVRRVIEGKVRPLPRGVPRELAAIATKAMARDPAARYPSAAELAFDLKRFHSGQLVEAYRYSRAALLGRWLWRHRLPAGLSALFLSILVAVVVGAFHRVVASRNHLILERARAFLGKDPTAAVAALKQYPPSGAEWGLAHAIAAEARAQGVARHVFMGSQHVLRDYATVFSPDGAWVAVPSLDSWSLELRDVAGGGLQARVGGIRMPQTATFLGRDVLLRTDEMLNFQLWRPQGGELHPLKQAPGERAVTFVPLGGGPGMVAGTIDGRILMWRDAGAEPIEIAREPQPVTVLDSDPRGRLVAVYDASGQVRLLDVATRSLRLLNHPGEEFDSMHFCDAGRQLLVVGPKSVRMIDVVSGREQGFPGESPVVVADCARQSGVMAAVVSPSRVMVWRAGSQPAELGAHYGASGIVLLPDGSRAVTNDDRGELHVWATDRSGAPALLEGESARGTLYAYPSPDGRWLEVVQSDAHRLYELPEPPRALDTTFPPGHPVLSRDRKQIVAAVQRDVVLFDVSTGRGRTLKTQPDASLRVEISHDGRQVVSVEGGRLHVIDVADGHSVDVAPEPGLRGSSFAADDRSIFSFASDTILHSTIDGRTLERIRAPGRLLHVQPTPDGGRLAGELDDPTHEALEPWVYDLAGHSGRILPGTVSTLVNASPDGQLLAAGDQRGCIRVWARDGAERRFCGHEKKVIALAFSPTAPQLASTSADGTVRIWDLRTGASQPLTFATQRHIYVAFSPDGALLAVVSDYKATVWEVASGRLVDLFPEDNDIYWQGWVDDRTLGIQTFTALHLWKVRPIPPGRGPADERRWLDELTTAELDRASRPRTP